MNVRPSFDEWLIAKCGGYTMSQQTNIIVSQCQVRVKDEARAAAITALR
jgi:hypothetical protein